jgi:hypothetical protein
VRAGVPHSVLSLPLISPYIATAQCSTRQQHLEGMAALSYPGKSALAHTNIATEAVYAQAAVPMHR